MAVVVNGKRQSREAELSALRRAISVERQARYSDFQGKRSTFSQFMRQTADRLCRRYPTDPVWTTVRGLFRQYPNLDVGTRISVIRRAEELLEPLWIATEAGVSGEAAIAASVKAPAKPSVGASPATKVTASTPNKSSSGLTTVPAQSTQTAKSTVNSKFPMKDPNEIPVQYVRGVGPKAATVLSRMNITTVGELIRHYPRKHLDFQNRLLIKDVRPGQEVTLFGAIRSVGSYQSKRGNVSIISILINDGTGSITITRFIGGKSNKFLLDRYKNQYPKGSQVLASGLVERDGYSNKLTLKNAEIELLGDVGDSESEDHDAADGANTNSIHAGRLVPVYPLTEGMSLRYIRNIMHNALESLDKIPDPVPDFVKEKNDLADLDWALRSIHFPADAESCERARHRLVFDELFGIQLQLAHRRYKYDQTEGALSIQFEPTGYVQQLRDSLPFKLTGAQERVFREIARDLASSKPMHRIVQGDVGSGKTVVALMAFLIAVENKFQGAMMAPTEILAEQHYRQFVRLLTPLGLKCCLVVGKQGVKERREVRQLILSGQVNIAIGTHALLEDDVEFQNLGLIVIDEQHRFGVKQRARLKAKSQSPELLTMTATPIPRTLALTLHGDLDVSEIDEMPPGRKPIDTKFYRPGQKDELWEKIQIEVLSGRQAYIVFPLIEESETLSAKAATQEYEKLRTKHPTMRFGLMHGKLRPQEKDEIMEQFRAKEFDVLVCTTVIEVGVDVPNATVMVIENADRFGLAALHQLRGRVGRGADQSFCYLVSDSKSDTTRQRLDIMTQTNDGFVIAEKDLEIRGPGEFLGVRQSGLPDLLLADLVNDAHTLEQARNSAIEVIKDDPNLTKYPLLKKVLDAKTSTMEAEIVRSG